jgi:hypothetical protein
MIERLVALSWDARVCVCSGWCMEREGVVRMSVLVSQRVLSFAECMRRWWPHPLAGSCLPQWQWHDTHTKRKFTKRTEQI